MSNVETLTKELNEAKAELVQVDKEYHELEFHRRHLHDIIRDRKAQLKNKRKGVLAPVTVTLYGRDEDQRVIERDEHPFNNVFEALESGIDFSQHDYMTMGISCSNPEDDFSAIYSMDMDKLCEPVAEGQVMLVSNNGYWSDDGQNYNSGILNSPTYFYALQEFHQSIYTTKDKHHIFMERIDEIGGSEADKLRKKHGEGIKFMTFCTGS